MIKDSEALSMAAEDVLWQAPSERDVGNFCAAVGTKGIGRGTPQQIARYTATQVST